MDKNKLEPSLAVDVASNRALLHLAASNAQGSFATFDQSLIKKST